MGFSTRLTDEMVQRYRRSGHWGDETFSAILERRAAAHPEREALVDRRHRVTYAELAARVDRVAAKLGALGIGVSACRRTALPRPRSRKTSSSRALNVSIGDLGCSRSPLMNRLITLLDIFSLRYMSPPNTLWTAAFTVLAGSCFIT